MSTFDVDSFMNTEMDGDISTEYSPIPDGEYPAVSDTVTPGTTPNGSPFLEVNWVIDEPGNDEAHGRKVRQTLWLDLLESGALDRGKGKNVQLGRLLKAVGLHGKRWNPAMLSGQPAMIRVSSRSDKQNPDRLYNDVKNVAER